jgi:enamine deaminase RidA (YjgF/YER057c/UK114 family)
VGYAGADDPHYQQRQRIVMTKGRTNISSGAIWEDIVGYSRAVRVGNVIEVSGTTATSGDTVKGVGDLYEQTVFILQKIEETLRDAGSSLKDVVRTRMFITNIDNWEEAGKAHAEFFGEIKPASSMIEVKRLINPELLIEIEATAIITI